MLRTKGRPRGTKTTHWNKQLCQQESLKYDSKRNFFKNNRTAYDYAYKHGFLDEICQHMNRLGNLKYRCVYVYEFTDKSVYVGITSDFQRRKLDREKRQYDTVTKYINETGLQYIHKQITDYINVEEAVRLEEHYVNQYRKNNCYLNLNYY